MKTFALIGHPVGHSVSPAIHHAAYAALGFDHHYVAIDCADEAAVRGALADLRRGALAGVNITVPWKTLALDLADHVDDSARRTGAANVWVRRQDGSVVAYNTDTNALAECLRAGLLGGVAELSALVLGTGGAARAAVVACRDLGAAAVFVSSRSWQPNLGRWERAEGFTELGATPVAWRRSPDEAPTAPTVGASQLDVLTVARKSRLIVQATSAGMRGIGNGEDVSSVVPWAELPAGAFVYDLVYNPAETPFLGAARANRVACEGGLSMLVGQAALAFELWLGVAPDRERMQQAANDAIFGVKR